VHVSISDIARIVAQDCKARYNIVEGQICAVNGHSMNLPLMRLPICNEKTGGQKRYIVHETYFKCLPAILKQGLSRMGRNHIHLSMETGRAGLQRKHKPNVAVYVDVVKAAAHGLLFYHCANDVIMCPGNRNGIISSYFFDNIRNIHTEALIEFVRPAAPARENMQRPARVSEMELPPPWGATGFEPGRAGE